MGVILFFCQAEGSEAENEFEPDYGTCIKEAGVVLSAESCFRFKEDNPDRKLKRYGKMLYYYIGDCLKYKI